MPLRSKSDDAREGEARTALAEALRRLDAYSFFTVPADPATGGDVIVVGTTGAFLVKACGLPGVAAIKGRRPLVGDRPVDGLRALRAGAKALTAKLSAKSALGKVEPIVCLTEAIAPPSAEASGVRFVRAADLAKDLSARPRLQSHTRAQSAARTLGVQVAGDHRRHFAVQ